MKGDFIKKMSASKKRKTSTGINYSRIVIRLFLLILGLGVIGVGYLFLNAWINISSLNVSFSQEFIINRSSKTTGSWLLVYVDSGDLYHADIIKICGYFPWEESRTINNFCLSGDGYLQIDRSKTMVKISSLLVRAALLPNPSVINGFLGIWEGSLAYSFDNILIIPVGCDSNGLLGTDLSNPDAISVLTLEAWNFVQNQSQIEALISCSYGNPQKSDLKAFRKQLNEYTIKSFDMITFASSAAQEDGTSIMGITYDSWDKMFREISMGTTIKLEQTQVEVFNSTEIPGYASLLGRWFSHLGLNVVRTDNIPGGVSSGCEKSQIYVPRNVGNFSESLESISFVLSVEQKRAPEIISGPPPFIYTGDIIVIVCDPLETTDTESN